MKHLPPLQGCRLAAGGQLCWREWGGGPTLIMLHGWSMSSVVFAEVAENLGQKFRVLCPDLPGHGGSEPIAETSLTSFADIIAQWSQALQLAPAALLGWSLGGQVALQLAIAKSIHLTRLLLVSSSPRFCQSADWAHALPITQLKALERNLRRTFEKTMGEFFNLQFAGEDLSQERYRQILQFAVRTSQLPKSDYARQVLQILGTSDLRGQLAGIELPTQILHGEIDRIIPPTAGRFLADNIPATTFELLTGVGHAPFFSKPDESVSRWLDFLL